MTVDAELYGLAAPATIPAVVDAAVVFAAVQTGAEVVGGRSVRPNPAGAFLLPPAWEPTQRPHWATSRERQTMNEREDALGGRESGRKTTHTSRAMPRRRRPPRPKQPARQSGRATPRGNRLSKHNRMQEQGQFEEEHGPDSLPHGPVVGT